MRWYRMQPRLQRAQLRQAFEAAFKRNMTGVDKKTLINLDDGEVAEILEYASQGDYEMAGRCLKSFL
jgi:hypothetical protein